MTRQIKERARKFGSCNVQQTDYLARLYNKLPAVEAVEAALAVFTTPTDAGDNFDEQELAGYLLWTGKHSCHLPAKEVLSALLDNWNLSVEEVPWYLCREFGQDTVMKAVEELIDDASSSYAHKTLSTLAFWVRNYKPPAQ
ncbi:hypothetical protein [Undibacterium sp. TS12]|uniref:hypothetical protein n=1 Tax=Undibacterium sp. TS12 TaxID=2908202 RepID=UPI001F4C8D4D|nr:hypothetical protein [Undibacterium sp. TS12]MCH8621007.1 hypothetical protein [Undibacterium sp. TS12]